MQTTQNRFRTLAAAALLLGQLAACSDDAPFLPFDTDVGLMPDGGDAVDPDAVAADVVDSDAVAPDVVDPDVVDPDVVDPDVVDPDVVDPDVVDPDVVDPDVVDPDVVDPDAVDPDVVDPDVVDPDVVDPDVVDPDGSDATDTDVVDPDGSDVVDPCSTGETCSAVGVSCDGDELVTCVPDEDACLRPFRTDCARTPFGFCETTGAVAMCSVADPCEGLDVCVGEDRSCDGDTLVVCAPDENGCLLEERTACDGAERGFCDETGDVICNVAPDPCAGLELCESVGVECVGDVRVSCAMDAFGCMVVARTDCAASDRVCEAGSCESRCGDGTVDADEDCDDSNRVSADGCSMMCEVELGWRCDDGAPSSCERTACGDSVIDTGEFCDDGDAVNGDGCSSSCSVEAGFTCVGEPSVCTRNPFCGDGTVNAGEQCDDMNTRAGDGCSATCRVETGYTCVGSPSSCTLDPFCGDGSIDAGEVCDDGDRFSNDGCSSTCREEPGFTCVGEPSVCTPDPFCGDGRIDGFEFCDDGDRFSGDGCSSSCAIEPGYTCTGEPSVCVLPSSNCGNSTIDASDFEACDDGNRESGDGCSADCGLELPTAPATAVGLAFSLPAGSPTFERQDADCSPPVARSENYPYIARIVTNVSSVARTYSFSATYSLDGYLLLYSLDFDPLNSIDSCLIGDDDFAFGTAASTRGSYVAEYTLAPGESIIVVMSTYSATATLPMTGQTTIYLSGCGNGAIDVGEDCDDANVVSGDGCSATCVEEPGFDCDGRSPTECVERACGDGIVQPADGEACDDENTANNDGCSSTCQVEAGWVCEPFTEPSECRFIACGDGFIDGAESCDDSNVSNGDGCSSSCTFEAGFFCTPGSEPTECRALVCGDSFIDYEAGERCDDGNATAGDGCSSTCRVEAGYRCEGTPSVCSDGTNICGDGRLTFGEGCDGNSVTPPEACAGDCVVSLPAPGTSITLTGSVDEDDGLMRLPTATCGAQGTEHFYDIYWFRNDTGARLEFDVSALFPAVSGDTALRVFSGTFDVTAPSITCVAGDDDFGFTSSDPFIGSRVVVAGGVVIVAVSSPDALSAPGGYTLTIDSAGCGDGEINVDELCDDGDRDNGDGCSSTCQTEDGFVCTGEPSLCDGDICGDGFFDPGEECDDGNFDSGDGCSSTCEIEDGYVCDGLFPSVCEPGVCGDGVRSDFAGEGCDDGNELALDGCSALCQLEAGGACTNESPQRCVLPVCGDDVAEGWETCDVPDGILCQSCATPLDLFEGSFELTGSIDDTDLFFSRPNAGSGGCTSADAREISYFDAWSYVNATASPVTITVSANWEGDGYLLLFDGDFDPQNNFEHCLWGDDDAVVNGSISTRGSQLQYDLDAGQSIVLVATTYTSDDPIGAYTIAVELD